MDPNEANDAIARSCGLSPDGLISLNIEIRDGRWPVVRALYALPDCAEPVRILATLVAREDIAHIEVPIAP